MKIVFTIPLILFLIISALLFTGHSGAAEEFSEVSFFLILGVIIWIWGLFKGDRGNWGDRGDQGYQGKSMLESVLIFLGFAIPYILIYRAFFIGGPLAFGDAPFFNPQNLKELFNPPFLWNFKDNNFGSTQYHVLWLYLPTYLYGLLNNLFGLGNDILVRIVFYFPATVLAIAGSYKFIGKFNQNILGKFLGSFLYGFNTYFLMLVDGGQVGVALAYGIFPITSLSILSYLGNLSIKNFILAVLSLFALVSADIRIAGISVVFTSLVWGIRGIGGIREIGESFKGFLFLGLAVLGLSAYWVWPLFSGFSLSNLSSLGYLSSGSNFINLTNTLFLFQPHFPLNEFGKTVTTPFYFAILPILIFGSLFLCKAKELKEKLFLSLLFLIFIFLAKGGSEPLGNFYSWFITLPGGAAFRDSSKFYIPLILIGGVLLSFTVSSLERVIKKKEVWGVLAVGVYGYLLILVYPALFGGLTGVLSPYAKASGDKGGLVTLGGDYLSQEQGFFRTSYFEEKPANVYFNWEKPAVSANSLYQERPFASMIVGKYDLNNFLHSSQLNEWLNLLGIKYAFFPENERKKVWSQKDKKEREEFLQFVSNVPGLGKLDWWTTFSVYQVKGQSAPHIFAQKHAFLVVGGEKIYQQLMEKPEFSLKKQGYIFLEDGRINLEDIKNINPQSLSLIFYNKQLEDLQMGYFVKDMLSPTYAIANQWKNYKSSDYLIWKYELLKNDIDTKDFDFGKGVATSTILGEKMKFKISVPKSGKYFLVARFTNSLGGGIKIISLGEEFKLKNENPTSFKWEIIGPIKVDEGDIEMEIVNEGGFVLFNTLALIPEEQFKAAEESARGLTEKYETFFIKGEKGDMGDLRDLGNIGEENFIPINYKLINPTQYQLIDLPEKPLWIVFSDHYHTGWDLEGSRQFPFYAMVNGFYIEKPQKENALVFTPQEEISKGIFLSAFSFGIIGLTLIFILVRGKKWKNA